MHEVLNKANIWAQVPLHNKECEESAYTDSAYSADSVAAKVSVFERSSWRDPLSE